MRGAGRAGVRRRGAGALAAPARLGACARRPGARSRPAAPGGRPQPVEGRRLPPAGPLPQPSRTAAPPRASAAGPSPVAPAAAPLPAARGPTRVRLTRRARRLAVVLALCGGVVLGSLLNSLVSGAAGDGLHLAGVSSVVVEPGDTLWSIAESVADGADVRVVVDSHPGAERVRGLGPGPRPGPAAPVTTVGPGPAASRDAGAARCAARNPPRRGNRSTTSGADFVNPQCGRVHPLLSLHRIRSSRVRRHGEPSSCLHQQAAGRRGLSGGGLVAGRTAGLAACRRRHLPGLGPCRPGWCGGDGLDRPRDPAPAGAAPGHGARAGVRRPRRAGAVGGTPPLLPARAPCRRRGDDRTPRPPCPWFATCRSCRTRPPPPPVGAAGRPRCRRPRRPAAVAAPLRSRPSLRPAAVAARRRRRRRWRPCPSPGGRRRAPEDAVVAPSGGRRRAPEDSTSTVSSPAALLGRHGVPAPRPRPPIPVGTARPTPACSLRSRTRPPRSVRPAGPPRRRPPLAAGRSRPPCPPSPREPSAAPPGAAGRRPAVSSRTSSPGPCG